MIRYLERKEIDDRLWDACITQAANGLPYGYTWYLDVVAGSWGALILDDYQAVFPLPYRVKYGISYLYQPFFTQQLGIFSLTPLTTGLTGQMMDAIPARFRFIEINVNPASFCEHNNFKFTPRVNMELPLANLYGDIRKGYKDNTRRTLQKAAKQGLKVVENIAPRTAIDIFKKEAGEHIEALKARDYLVLATLADTLVQKGLAKIYAVKDGKDEMIAIALIIHSHKRHINLLSAATPQGKILGGTPFLLDALIQQYAESDTIFDFEGSMIPGIARFYRSLGALEKHYWQLKRKKVPWYLRFYKR